MYTNDPLAMAVAIHVITRSNPARRVHQPTGRAASRSTRPVSPARGRRSGAVTEFDD